MRKQRHGGHSRSGETAGTQQMTTGPVSPLSLSSRGQFTLYWSGREDDEMDTAAEETWEGFSVDFIHCLFSEPDILP